MSGSTSRSPRRRRSTDDLPVFRRISITSARSKCDVGPRLSLSEAMVSRKHPSIVSLLLACVMVACSSPSPPKPSTPATGTGGGGGPDGSGGSVGGQPVGGSGGSMPGTGGASGGGTGGSSTGGAGGSMADAAQPADGGSTAVGD